MSHADYVRKFVSPGGTVLDVGAGKGAFLVEMAKLGFRAVGIETNPAYISETKIRATKEHVSVEVTEGRAERLPFPDATVDFANSSEVSEHVDDPEAMLREIFRVVRNGGKAYVSFHNRFGIYDYHYHLYFINWMPRFFTEPMLRVLGKQKQDSGDIGRQKLTTMHYYRYGEIKKLLCRIGFTVEDIRMRKIKERFGGLSFPVTALYVSLLRPLYYNTFHLLLEKPRR